MSFNHKNFIRGLLILLVGVTFIPSLHNGFTNWDDDNHLIDNPRIRNLSFRSARIIFTTHAGYSYDMPLSELSFAVSYRLFGLNPRGHHLVNLVLHLINCLLVFQLLLSISGSTSIAFWIALFFGVCPLQVESVAWISERKNLLYSTFFLSSLLLYRRSRGGRTGTAYLLSLLFFLLSLLAKPIGILFPFLLFLFDYLPGPGPRKFKLGNKLPFFAFSLIFIMAITPSFGDAGIGGITAHLFSSLGINIIKSVHTLVFYILKLLWPFHLSCIYPQPEDAARPAWTLIKLSPLFLSAVIILIIRSVQYTRRGIFAGLFFIFTVSFTLPLTLAYPWSAADRYLYLGSLSFFYLVLSHCFYLKKLNPSRGPLIFTLLAIWALCFIALSWKRCGVWRNSETLWNNALRYDRGIFLAYNNLGMVHSRQGRINTAEKEFRRALEIKPFYSQANFNLAYLLEKGEKLKEACYYYTRALRGQGQYHSARINLASLLARRGEISAALEQYNRLLRESPPDPLIYYNLGNLHQRLGNLKEAIFCYREALRLRPDYPAARTNLQTALSALP